MSVHAPAVVNVNEQLPTPEARVPEQVTVVELNLAVTVTLPVGVVTPATLKPTVTSCAVVDGFGVFDVMVVVLVAFFAATLFVTLVAPL